jgi:hypothetical protein
MANCGAGFGCVLGHLRKQTPVVLASPPPHFIHSDKASLSKLFQAGRSWRTAAAGKQKGKAVNVRYTIPIVFKLPK